MEKILAGVVTTQVVTTLIGALIGAALSAYVVKDRDRDGNAIPLAKRRINILLISLSFILLVWALLAKFAGLNLSQELGAKHFPGNAIWVPLFTVPAASLFMAMIWERVRNQTLVVWMLVFLAVSGWASVVALTATSQHVEEVREFERAIISAATDDSERFAQAISRRTSADPSLLKTADGKAIVVYMPIATDSALVEIFGGDATLERFKTRYDLVETTSTGSGVWVGSAIALIIVSFLVFLILRNKPLAPEIKKTEPVTAASATTQAPPPPSVPSSSPPATPAVPNTTEGGNGGEKKKKKRFSSPFGSRKKKK